MVQEIFTVGSVGRRRHDRRWGGTCPIQQPDSDAMTKANKYMKSKYAMPNDNFTTE